MPDKVSILYNIVDEALDELEVVWDAVLAGDPRWLGLFEKIQERLYHEGRYGSDRLLAAGFTAKTTPQEFGTAMSFHDWKAGRSLPSSSAKRTVFMFTVQAFHCAWRKSFHSISGYALDKYYMGQARKSILAKARRVQKGTNKVR